MAIALGAGRLLATGQRSRYVLGLCAPGHEDARLNLTIEGG